MNFNRFKKVVLSDFNSTIQLYGMSMLIMMCVPLCVWLFGLAFRISNIEFLARVSIMQFVVILAAAISSMKIYKSCNLPGQGNYFAMRPAALGEKFTSMLLYCFILTPLAVALGFFAVDTLLTLLPFGPYKTFIWHKPDWVQDLGEVGTAYINSSYFSFDAFVSTALKAISTAAIFMFTNTIFKKNKFVKTILWIALISFVVTIVMFPIITHVNWDFSWLKNLFNDMTPQKFHNLVFWTTFTAYALVTLLFSFLSFRRLKKMQY